MKIRIVPLVFILVLLANQTAELVAQSDTIYVAAEPDYPPYSFVNEEGNPDGFAVELFYAAAQAAGLQVQMKIGVWNAIKEDLAEGRIDALPLVGRTPEREDAYDFTMPFLSLHGAIFTRKKTSDIQSLSDLKDKDIVVMRGDNAEEFVRREHISDKIFTTTTFEDAFKQLADGLYDASITQRITGLQLIDQLKIKNLQALDITLPSFRQDFCFAVKDGDSELLNQLNEGLSIVIANDTYDSIQKKWMGPGLTEGYTLRETLKVLIPAFIVLALIVFLAFILFLRREVRRKTRRLNSEIQQHKLTLNKLSNEQHQLKNSEEKMRLLLDSTAEGIYGMDTQGKCTMINQSALKLLGYSDPSELIGKNMHRLIHHSYADGQTYRAEDCLIYQAFKEGHGTHAEGEVLWRADGSYFQAEYFSFPMRIDERITGTVVTFWDITERKKAEAELLNLKTGLEHEVAQRTAELNEKVEKLDRSQKAMLFMVEDLNRITAELKMERKKLEESNQELEAFTYSVSHDLRAPLRAINGFSNFLLEDYADKLDEEGKRFLDTIRSNANKMDKLILDLLNLSRISRSSLNKGVINMSEMVNSVFQELASENEKQLFTLKVDDVIPSMGDPSLIKQVWINLISNALKYSAQSENKLIEIHSREEANEIVYSIRDHGAGFNASYAPKLFGIFQRLHRDSEFEGLGVGLAIVKRIITRHGGRVWAKGEENKGAEFFFTLPK